MPSSLLPLTMPVALSDIFSVQLSSHKYHKHAIYYRDSISVCFLSGKVWQRDSSLKHRDKISGQNRYDFLFLIPH